MNHVGIILVHLYDGKFSKQFLKILCHHVWKVWLNSSSSPERYELEAMCALIGIQHYCVQLFGARRQHVPMEGRRGAVWWIFFWTILVNFPDIFLVFKERLFLVEEFDVNTHGPGSINVSSRDRDWCVDIHRVYYHGAGRSLQGFVGYH